MEPEPTGNRGLRLAAYLFGPTARSGRLLVAAALLLIVSLGARDLWTQEGRWGVITQEMVRSGDYLHPYNLDEEYYDKPLLSYWLQAGLSKVIGGVNEWALRLPSALAGLLAIGCTCRLGRILLGKPVGLLAGWVLLTSYYFVFWSRTASADVLNVAGTVAALTWFFERRDRPGFVLHSVFFAILAVTCLMKGLIGAVVPVLALIPFLLPRREWRAHLRPSLFLGAIPAAAIYLTPFLLSSASAGGEYRQSGLAMVIRENVDRFFRPFDHKGGVFTYFEYLPLYIAPWAAFLPFAAWAIIDRRKDLAARWKRLEPGLRGMAWAFLIIFAFLTASGSRRSYYVLPLLPFAAILIAGWILSPGKRAAVRASLAAWLAAVTAALLFAWFGIVQPYHEGRGGLRAFAREARAVLELRAPLDRWDFILWKATPKTAFYMSPEKKVQRLGRPDEKCEERLKPFLLAHPRTVVVSHRSSLDEISPCTEGAIVLEEPSSLPSWLPRWLESDQSREKKVVLIIPR